jgi:hypothetical protein
LTLLINKQDLTTHKCYVILITEQIESYKSIYSISKKEVIV